MKAELTKLVTRYNPNKLCQYNGNIVQYDFTLYKRAISYYVHPFQSPYGTLQGLIDIPSYGFIIRAVTESNNEESFPEWDTKPLSARYYQVEGLIYALCQIKEPSIEKINSMIAKRQKKWINQQNGFSPFEKVAQKMLLRSSRHTLEGVTSDSKIPSNAWKPQPLQAMERMKRIWNQ